MSKEKISGIYKIENIKNGVIYIGLSTDIQKRWKRHKYDFKNNIHENQYFQRAWDKYGESSFIFEIIEECSRDLLNEREIFWIDYYNSYKIGYNLTIGGKGKFGYHLTDETKNKIRKNRKNFRHTIETKNKISEMQTGRRLTSQWKTNISNSHKKNIASGKIIPNTINLTNHIEKTKKKIKCYNKDGSIIGVYNSIHDAGNALKIEPTNICKVLKGKYNTSNGLTFCYVDEMLEQLEIDRRFKNCFTKNKTKLNTFILN